MSTIPEFELDLDLQLLPAWARQSPAENRYARYEGGADDERSSGRGDRFGRREPWRDRPARPGRGPGARPGEGPRDRPSRGEGGRGPRDREAPYGRGGREGLRPDRAEPPVPLPDIDVEVAPEEKGVESLARQIKLTGRAYPLFDIAQLILKRPERFDVRLAVRKGTEGNILQRLFVCSLDESLWLNEDEVVAHVMRHHFSTFYQTEKTPAEPPKGTYTFVAQCGLSGAILGPPNFHDYPAKLRKLHAERFGRMPFEVYKSRVKIVRDEAVVKQWIEEQSWRTEFVALNVPEPVRLATREEAEQHFRTTYLVNLVRPVETFTVAAAGRKAMMSPMLSTVIRRGTEDQRRFPLRVATILSQQFAGHGLQFFKVNRAVTHVCVARPHYLDLQATVVSEGVRKIVEYINSHAGCTRRRLIDALAPTPAAPTPTPPPPPAAEGTPPVPGAPQAPPPTPEQTAIIADLHWLVHQGHVIEFTDGRMETAKAPKPKPPQAAPPAAAGAGRGAVTPPVSTAEPAAEAASSEAKAVAPSSSDPAPAPAPTPVAGEVTVAASTETSAASPAAPAALGVEPAEPGAVPSAGVAES